MSRVRLALVVVAELISIAGLLGGNWGFAFPAVMGLVSLAGVRGGRFGAELRLSPEGVTVSEVEMPWSNVDRMESVRMFGVRQDRLMLQRGIVRSHGGGTARWIDLRSWDSQWRNGPIGADIARWAPRLLEEKSSVDA